MSKDVKELIQTIIAAFLVIFLCLMYKEQFEIIRAILTGAAFVLGVGIITWIIAFTTQ